MESEKNNVATDLHGTVSKDEHRGITRTRYVNQCRDLGFYSE